MLIIQGKLRKNMCCTIFVLCSDTKYILCINFASFELYSIFCLSLKFKKIPRYDNQTSMLTTIHDTKILSFYKKKDTQNI